MIVVNVMLGAGAGGLEAVSFQYADIFLRNGHSSWMLCHRQSPFIARSAANIAAIPHARAYSLLDHIRIGRILRNIKPQIVFCHGHRAAAFYTWIVRSFVPKARFIAVCHGSNGWRCKRFNQVIAVSDGVRDELIDTWGLDPLRVLTVKNAVFVPEYPLPEPEGVHTIGSLGRLDVCKGVDILIRAFAQVCRRPGLESTRLCIGGAGPEESVLRRLAAALSVESKIDWVGWVSDKARFFSRVNLLAIPSREEGLPLSALEAMSYGRAIVVSDCPGLVSLAEGGCGLVVSREDVDALANALVELLEDAQMRREQAARGRQRILDQYSECVLEKTLLALSEEVSGSKEWK